MEAAEELSRSGVTQADFDAFRRRVETERARHEIAEKYGLDYEEDKSWIDAKRETQKAVTKLSDQIRYDVTGEPYLAHEVACEDCGKKVVPPKGWIRGLHEARCGKCWRDHYTALAIHDAPTSFEGHAVFGVLNSASELPSSAKEGQSYYCLAENQAFRWYDRQWLRIALPTTKTVDEPPHIHTWRQLYGDRGYLCRCGARSDVLR